MFSKLFLRHHIIIKVPFKVSIAAMRPSCHDEFAKKCYLKRTLSSFLISTIHCHSLIDAFSVHKGTGAASRDGGTNSGQLYLFTLYLQYKVRLLVFIMSRTPNYNVLVN